MWQNQHSRIYDQYGTFWSYGQLPRRNIACLREARYCTRLHNRCIQLSRSSRLTTRGFINEDASQNRPRRNGVQPSHDGCLLCQENSRKGNSPCSGFRLGGSRSYRSRSRQEDQNCSQTSCRVRPKERIRYRHPPKRTRRSMVFHHSRYNIEYRRANRSLPSPDAYRYEDDDRE